MKLIALKERGFKPRNETTKLKDVLLLGKSTI